MPRGPRALHPVQIDQFIDRGFLRIDDAFPRELAQAARAILWADTGCAADDPTTSPRAPARPAGPTLWADPGCAADDPTPWTKAVARLGHYGQPPFRAAASTPRLHAAFDDLAGPGRWTPPSTVGTFPVRFPSA